MALLLSSHRGTIQIRGTLRGGFLVPGTTQPVVLQAPGIQGHVSQTTYLVPWIPTQAPLSTIFASLSYLDALFLGALRRTLLLRGGTITFWGTKVGTVTIWGTILGVHYISGAIVLGTLPVWHHFWGGSYSYDNIL